MTTLPSPAASPGRFATLSHELGQVYCGHVGPDRKGRWPDRQSLPTVLCEAEAEAVAWLVCQRNGVQARSREYLSSLIAQVDVQAVILYAIFEAANRVESRTPAAWRQRGCPPGQHDGIAGQVREHRIGVSYATGIYGMGNTMTEPLFDLGHDKRSITTISSTAI